MEYLNEEGLAALWDDTKEYVEKYHGENSGEQESDGTEAGPISELTAKGHAEQVSTTGKNLLGLADTGQTASGVTLTVTNSRISLSGTPTGQTDFQVALTNPVDIASGQSYTISFDGSVPKGRFSAFLTVDGSFAAGSYFGFLDISDGAKSKTVTAGSAMTIGYLKLRVFPVETSINASLQLELGSTATSYEPYTGGAPSPSPDYPQEIQVVRGRNLLDGEFEQGSNAGSLNNRIRCKAHIPMTAGSVVTVSASDYATFRYLVSAFPTDAYPHNTSDILGETGWVDRSTTFTVPAGTKFVTVMVKKNDDSSLGPVDISNVDIQLERGYISRPYVPHGCVGLDVQREDVTKVMFDGSESWGVDNEQLCIYKTEVTRAFATPDFGATYGWSDSYPTAQTSNANMPAASIKMHGGNRCIYIRDTRYTTLADFKSALAANPVTAYYLNDKHTGVVPQSPFHSTTPIPLPSRGWAAGLPDGTADTLTLDGAGKVTWELDTNKYICTGNETLADAGNLGNGYWRVWLASVLNANKSVGNVDNLLCTHSIGKIAYKEASNHVYISSDGGSILCYAKANDANGVLVAFTGAEFIYPLATPVTEQRGYVDLPEIPEGASISIPELDDLGVKYHVDGAASTLAHQWYERAHSEYEDRIAALEEAVAEIIAGA